MKRIQTYYQTLWKSLESMVQEVKSLMKKGKFNAVFQMIESFDNSISDKYEAFFFLQKDWNVIIGHKISGTLSTEQAGVEENKLMKRMLSFLERLKNEFVPDQLFHQLPIEVDEGNLWQWKEESRPLQRMKWLQKLLKSPSGIVLVEVIDEDGSAVMGPGILFEENGLLVEYALLSNAATAATSRIQLRTHPFYRQPKTCSIQPGSWKGSTALGYAYIKIKEIQGLQKDQGFEWSYQSFLTVNESVFLLEPQLENAPAISLQIAKVGPDEHYKKEILANFKVKKAGIPVFNEDLKLVGMTIKNNRSGNIQLVSISQLLADKEQFGEEAPQSTAPVEKRTVQFLGLHHQYSCNRINQHGDFTLKLDSDIPQRVHLFFMYGCDRQEHKGLFNWFVAKMSGKDLDYLAPKTVGYPTVIHKSIVFPKGNKEELLKIALVKKLATFFHVPGREQVKLGEKNLQFIVDHGRKLKTLQPNDRVAILFNIAEGRWNASLIPQIITWFMRAFCAVELPKNAPQFFFFFGVEYDPDRLDIPQQIEAILEDLKNILDPMEELGMVTTEDVEDWFDTYEEFWDSHTSRDLAFKENFDGKPEEMFMDEVQRTLKTIIHKINEPVKDVKRNSHS